MRCNESFPLLFGEENSWLDSELRISLMIFSRAGAYSSSALRNGTVKSYSAKGTYLSSSLQASSRLKSGSMTSGIRVNRLAAETLRWRFAVIAPADEWRSPVARRRGRRGRGKFPADQKFLGQLASAKNSESRPTRLKTIKTHLNFPETKNRLHPSTCYPQCRLPRVSVTCNRS